MKLPKGLRWNFYDLQNAKGVWVACIQKTHPVGYYGLKPVWAWRLPNRGWHWDTTVTTKQEAKMSALALYLRENRGFV